MEASRHLAELALKNAPDFNQRLDFITLRLLSRPLTTEERKLAKDTLDASLEFYSGNAEAATTLINTGDPVATFVPDNAERAVQIDINGRDVALVTPGAKARLQFEG